MAATHKPVSADLSEERFTELANNMSNLAWMAKADGWIYWYNKRWYEYTGTKPEDMEGWGWQLVHDPDELPRVLRAWQSSISSGKPFDMVFPLKGADGKFRPFLTRVVPVKNDDGEIVHWYGTNTDVDGIAQTAARRDELELTTAELREQRQHLIAMNKAKDEFISLASHQLRTPATSVKQYVGMLIEGYAGETTPQQQEFLQRAYNSNDRQLKIIDDLLKVALVDAGKVEPQLCEVKLAPLIQDVLDTQSDMFKKKEQDVSFVGADQTYSVRADPTLLRMVLENLTHNASKYTHCGKKIFVELRKNNRNVEIHVKDQGVGIPENQRQNLFQKFNRIPNELSTEVGGSGLGLYWAKKVIDLHAGQVNVVSTAGQGSTFTVLLPI
ncbi:MAG: PAS domain-containing sensor histidine kinase [Patescibacteria group bacterium]|nr:PAS domain-containing sensor histidine kinase [Patescibacteria group bacterium]